MYGERISFIAGDAWRELDSTFFTRLHNSLSNRPAFIKPVSPRPHQKEAIKEAFNYFTTEGNERGKLIMPCGSGKSLTGWWLAEKLDAKTILVAVPSLALVKQTLEVWARESVANSRNIRWIAVCSDQSVAHDEREDAAVLVQDLGVKVHTDPQEIAGWLKYPHEGLTVVFTTYQSGRAIAEASRTASVSFDLAILDEAHKTVGKRGSLFDHLLHDDNIDINRRVFMTATERRYRGDSDNILSMEDPDAYGETFYLLSFKSALECDPPILSDYKIVTVAVTYAEIENMVKANLLVKPDKGEWNDELEAEMLASLVALRKAMQKFPIRHAVSFHSSISKARAFRDSQNVFTATFSEYGLLDTFHVTGSTPTAVRKREIDDFAKAERSLITNARCLTEGVDVPGIDCVLFADPKRSAVDIVQAVGRALRPTTGKEMGYVVIPVIVDEAGIPEETRFDSVLMVLRALATNDERIVEYFRTVSQGKHYTGSSPVEFTVPDGININTDNFINAIELNAWSRLAKLSWRPFEEARELAKSLKLKNINEWRAFCKDELPEIGILPEDVPAKPDRTYKDKGWHSYGDWLGTGTIADQFKIYRPFEEAREYARSLKLKNEEEWQLFCKGLLPEKRLLHDLIFFQE
jgi:predicted helicase